MTKTDALIELKPGDRVELEHIGDGGKWCLDGRKERRLKRLGLIQPKFSGFGWMLSRRGEQTLRALIEQEKSDG